ncbi:Membrane fusion component of tripartite multidrug resistance system [Acidisarcina polymorpha]|uniref:Membrane fusion component of tripartite multidrug resistance system n=1 Tax=Acidisarcina polymorpha TaxID=2211140 RepID=A0A2Z5G6R3_9BACT|nr:HlyD family secretion protein [Acidisarcina polymorpha]AXC14364.1 Membrane fusion component of tripartite multidrug resistance system [Acidisarcina polymorpha]
MADQNPEPANNGDETERSEKPRQKSRRRFIIIGVVMVLIVGALLFWWRSTFYEDTDDAQIDGHLIQISTRIAGQVVKVYVEENSQVKAGDTIAELDPKDFQVAVQQDEANLQAAEAAYEAAKVNVPITGINTGSTLRSASSDVEGAQAQVTASRQQLQGAQAQIAQAEANYTKAKLDLERYTPLVQKDVISKQQFDQAVATADADKAALDNAKANEAAARAQVRVSEERVKQAVAQFQNAQSAPKQIQAQKARADQAAAQVQQAKAQLEQAKLNLSYTKVIAPVDGIVTRKSVEVNQNVSVGQNLMTLVSLDDIWITANFKETQLREMRAGQSAVISVDAYGGRKYDAKVTQIGGATGSVLSLFPPENATGNYVKVVQRVPVRIDLVDPRNENKDHLLRPGLSVEPKVRVKE